MEAQEAANKFRDYFLPNEHELRPMRDGDDWVIWSVYLRREAITNRLDAMFGPFGWSFEVSEPAIDGKIVSHQGSIIINGQRRDNNGGATMGGDENAVKASLTDCFKRCASSWGIGLYLQNTPAIFTNGGIKYTEGPRKGKVDNKKQAAAEQQARPIFETWLNSLGGPSIGQQSTQDKAAEASIDTTSGEITTPPVTAARAKKNSASASTSAKSGVSPDFDHDHAQDSMNDDYDNTQGEFEVQAVDVGGQDEKPYIIAEDETGKRYYAFTRQPFRDAGIICEHWDAVGRRHVIPPVRIEWKANKSNQRIIQTVEILPELAKASGE